MASNIIIQDAHIMPWVNVTGATVTSGTCVLIGSNLVGVALVTIASNATGSVQIAEAAVTYAKNTGAGTGGVAGTKAYWDDTTKKFTAVLTGNTEAGYFWTTCANGDAMCTVRLRG